MNKKHALFFDWNQEVLFLFGHSSCMSHADGSNSTAFKKKIRLEILTACDLYYSIKYHFYSEAHMCPSFAVSDSLSRVGGTTKM